MEPARTQNRTGPPEAPGSKDRILDVAERLFAQRGFAATSMRNIAQGAGVNVATLYYHCGSKDELFVSIYSRVVEQMIGWIGETFKAGGDFRFMVAEILDHVIEYLALHPSIARLLMRSDLGEMPKANHDKREVYRPLLETVTRVINARVERGEIRTIDPLTFVRGAQGVVTYIALGLTREQDLMAPPTIDPKQLALAQRHARLFVLGALGLDPDSD